MKPGLKLVAAAAVLIGVAVGGVLGLVALQGGPEDRAVRAIERLGGNVLRDPATEGHPIVGVELGNTPVHDADLVVLRQFPDLRELHLIGTEVTDAGMKELGQLRGLQTLNLRRTRVTDRGLRELGELVNLRSLDLADTQVTDAGLRELRGLAGLRWLDVDGTRVTGAGVSDLRAALPELDVRH
jgi:hypothetical protein